MDADDGIVQQGLRALRSDLGDSTVLMADLCLCEYTDHGHCSPLTVDRSTVDNAVTLVRYASVALAQVEAGADVVDVPLAAYQVSGEYAMLEAAAVQGWIERDPASVESVMAITRAGAQLILTHWATEPAVSLDEVVSP